MSSEIAPGSETSAGSESGAGSLTLMGSLTIVGLGPARPEHRTTEALHALQDAAETGKRVYGLAHARQIVAAVVPSLTVTSLDWLYALPGVDRPTLYRDLAALLMRRAFEDGQDVLYVVAGSPLFINDAVLQIRRKAAAAGLPLRLIHGVSFVDLVLDRVFWTGHRGLQIYSAWNIASDRLPLSVDSPALLCQLGEHTAGAEALQTEGSPTMLAALQARLLERYPPSHRVAILYSSGHPAYTSLSRAVALSQLAESAVPVYSNLWVPALTGDPMEAELAP